jgi:tetratricopeptide (TPR) repeat protein
MSKNSVILAGFFFLMIGAMALSFHIIHSPQFQGFHFDWNQGREQSNYEPQKPGLQVPPNNQQPQNNIENNVDIEIIPITPPSLFYQQDRKKQNTSSHSHPTRVEEDPYLENILEGEEYLTQNSKQASEKAVSIFSRLSARDQSRKHEFRIRYGLAIALEKSGDPYRALEIYKELNRKDWKKEDQDKLSVSLGSLLLKLNYEEEGKIHLQSALRTSNDRKIRSVALQSLAESQFARGENASARKNYELSLQEDPYNQNSRVGLSKALRRLGKDWYAMDVMDEYIQTNERLKTQDKEAVKEYKSEVYQKAKSYYSQKDYIRADEFFKKAIELNESPNIVEHSLYYLALSAENQGKSNDSIQYLNKVLNNGVYTMDQEALFKKGTIYFKKNQIEKAASIFNHIIEKYPKNHITEKAIQWRKECLEELKLEAGVETSNPSLISENDMFEEKPISAKKQNPSLPINSYTPPPITNSAPKPSPAPPTGSDSGNSTKTGNDPFALDE